MIKLYITAIETKDNGSAVTLFEDYLLGGFNKEELEYHEGIGNRIFKKIEEVELSNNQASTPF